MLCKAKFTNHKNLTRNYHQTIKNNILLKIYSYRVVIKYITFYHQSTAMVIFLGKPISFIKIFSKNKIDFNIGWLIATISKQASFIHLQEYCNNQPVKKERMYIVKSVYLKPVGVFSGEEKNVNFMIPIGTIGKETAFTEVIQLVSL